jgi:hypothetical protein
MIFILILASLAAVYYIAPLAEPVVKPERHPPKPEAAVLTPGLVPLGRALDQYGRGREPVETAEDKGEEVRKTERDRL